MVADFKKKKSHSPYQRLWLSVGLAALAVLLVCLVVADVKVYQKRKELNAQVSGLQQKVQSLKAQNANLQEGLARQNDDTYIEKVAREQLDLQQPGETVVSFVKPDGQAPTAPVQKNNWQAAIGSALNAFIGIFKK